MGIRTPCFPERGGVGFPARPIREYGCVLSVYSMRSSRAALPTLTEDRAEDEAKGHQRCLGGRRDHC